MAILISVIDILTVIQLTVKIKETANVGSLFVKFSTNCPTEALSAWGKFYLRRSCNVLFILVAFHCNYVGNCSGAIVRDSLHFHPSQ